MSLVKFNEDSPLGKKEIFSLRKIVNLLSDKGEIPNYFFGKDDSAINSGSIYCFTIRGEIVSFMKYSDDTIHLIATHPDHIGCGYATKLIKNIQKKVKFINTRVDAITPEGIENLLLRCNFEQHKNGKNWRWEKSIKN